MQKTYQSHSHHEIQIFTFILRTLKTAPVIKGMYIPKATKYLKESLLEAMQAIPSS